MRSAAPGYGNRMSAVRTGVEAGVAQRFVEALRTLEREGDPTALADLYAEKSRSGNVQHPDGFRGPDGARQFWLTYRSTFGEVRSEFRTVVASDDAVALEWTTEGTVGGRPVRYDGVTVLDLVGGQIARSCAYYDATRLGREALRASATGGPAETSGHGDDSAAADDTSGDDSASAADTSGVGSAEPTADEVGGGGPGGVDARPVPETDGWRTDPEEVG